MDFNDLTIFRLCKEKFEQQEQLLLRVSEIYGEYPVAQAIYQRIQYSSELTTTYWEMQIASKKEIPEVSSRSFRHMLLECKSWFSCFDRMRREREEEIQKRLSDFLPQEVIDITIRHALQETNREEKKKVKEIIKRFLSQEIRRWIQEEG